ncbi:1,6-dihydroxycyclohexa-2,4-diene-1-carboxylate dehydrogenase [Nocardioides panacisoli]|uniref:benzoate 1,2-dioxygenase electron transfer component BenC n=1 Tax=Nocardioides panacisoli TaxID=627624 RepID=UPI001C639128|nr:benzoate 1,2-dioxygenase electron transfer component BenC [Nocardioides panacisoli]QYJ03072.1 1,6-dihydroxycyclohexa-2,4-diene-1-carboxylate dehydrogenase [Nocardioides panacisoli]
MSHQVALAFEDGVTRFIDCDDDQTVADASYRARINIPLDCRDGACGTCKSLCESGEYDGGSYVEDAMTESEAAAGYVLTCQTKPKSDLVLQIASTSAVAKTRAATYTGTLTRLDRLSPTTVAITVETPDRSDLAFLPGQYVNIAVPGTEETRSYSFSNGPGEEGLSFLVKLTPGGAMSDYLTERAAVGDEITFTGPNGSFFLREAERPVLLLAGGTGLAPILSILRQLHADDSARPVHLVYGVSSDDDLVELDAIRALADGIDGLTWDYCVADPDSRAPNTGYVMGLIDAEHLHGGDVAVYLCGPPPMVEAVRTQFADAGVEPTGFYYEKFALSGASAATVPEESEDPLSEESPATDQPAPAASEPRDRPGPEAGVAPPALAGVIGLAGEGRALIGQVVLPVADPSPVGPGAVPDREAEVATARCVMGQTMCAPTGEGPVLALDEGEHPVADPDARAVIGQPMLPAPAEPAHPTDTPVPSDREAPGQYEIGEEHPSVHESDAIFEAREALELGAVELTIGRLSSSQLAGYRLLAESTLTHVEGDRFTDAAAYTESNAAFHDYLFTLTGNEHLLQAYRALGVQGHMEEVLRHATWCHPRCARDHVEIVDAFAAGDRATARRLVAEHGERSKLTMRRAMADQQGRLRPAYVSPGRYDGQVVLVTGAAQGIGEAVARRVSAEGGAVVLADRSDLVHGVAEELAGAGREALAVTADLEQYDGATTIVDLALARFGRVDVLVNNVGGAINFKPFTEFTDADIRAEVDRSLMTTLHACRAVLPGMVARGRGVILNVSSAATRGIHRIPYSAAKGGINAITASLAMEYAEAGIRVVATAPGGTEAPPRRIPRGTPEPGSDRERAWFRAHIDQTLESSLMHRYGTLDEQAAAITFLASPEASYITGTVLPVAGGDPG